MSNIKNWALENIISDSNVDLGFRETLAAFQTEPKEEKEEQVFYDDEPYQEWVDNCLSWGEDYR